MFCAILGEKVIAIHEDEDIINEYIKLYKHFHEDANNIYLGKIKNKKAAKYDDLYLEMIGDSFVQAKFVQSYSFFKDQIIEDNKRAKGVLERILSEEELDRKEKKHLMKTIELLESLIYENDKYIPDIGDLNNNKDQFDSMMRNIYESR